MRIQRLPIKLSPTATRGGYRPWRPALLRRRGTVLLAAGGLLLGAAGAMLAGWSQPFQVAMGTGSYTVQGHRIPGAPSGSGFLYRGAGTVEIEHAGGHLRAGASAEWKGKHLRAACLVDARGRSERCLFSLDRVTIAATDSRTAGGWDRRYDDGPRVRILTSGPPPVPVPFPVGRG